MEEMRTFQPLPVSRTSSGAERRVGVEVEYSSLGVADSASIVQRLFGGKLVEKNRYSISVVDSALGTFRAELDTSLLKDKRYEEVLHHHGIELNDVLNETVERALELLLSLLIPFEITAPPVPATQLGEIQRLFDALRTAGAEGTKASLLNAFGLHLNVELATGDSDEALAVLRAYLALADELQKAHAMDFARQLSNFVTAFPEDYAAKVLDPRYRPSRREFMVDYLRDNPTRDRPLDLLPIFCCWDEKLVRSMVDKPYLLNPRLAYHYRLPNSDIDNSAWSLAQEWNLWVSIERLAADSLALQNMLRLFTRDRRERARA